MTVKIEAAARLNADSRSAEWHLADAIKTQQKVDKYIATLKPGTPEHQRMEQKKASADNAVAHYRKLV